MQHKRTKVRHSLFFRIMVVFALCILPLLLTQVCMNVWGTQVVRSELLDSASANALYLRDHFNENINSISTQLLHLQNFREIASFFVYHSNYSTSEYYAAISRIFDTLIITRSTNEFISEIRLYYPRMGMCLVNDSVRRAVYEVDGQEMMLRLEAFSQQGSGFYEYEGEYLVGSIKNVPYPSPDSLPPYYLEVVLNRERMREHLSSFSAGDRKLSLQYSHETGAVLFSSRKITSQQEIKSLLGAEGIPTDGSVFSRPVWLAGTEYTLVACYSPMLHATFGQLLSTVELEQIPRTFQFFILFFAFLCVVIIVLLGFSIHRQVTRPTHRLLRAFSATGEGHFDTRVNGSRYAQEYRELAERFNEMNAQISSLIASNYEHTIHLQRAQFKQLQAQINPHFLYNSFFLLRHMVRSDDREVCMQFLGCLGRYFQYITDNEHDMATLEEEFGHAHNYLSIQRMRFEDQLELDIQPVPDHLRLLAVPRLILQPLLENVLTHSHWDDGRQRQIRMRFAEEDGMLQIRVEDNGDGVEDETIAALQAKLQSVLPLAETSGLSNISQRLHLHYHSGGCLTVLRSELGGFCAAITIPMEEESRV